MRIGFHVHIGGGLLQSIRHALDRRCQTMQIFASAPVQWKTRKVDLLEAEEFVAARKRFDLWPLFVHAPYLLNLATADMALLEKSVKRLIFDMQMAHLWEAEGVVLHLGSAGAGTAIEEAMERVAAALRVVLEHTEAPTKLILENSAGQGNIVGDTPEELGRVIELAGGERLALCLDTAHAFAAGYAVHTQEGLNEFLGTLDRACGDRLALVHANDSASDLGSKWDRHWHIGQGKIGPEGWRTITSHPRLRELPFIMETPKGHGGGLGEDLANLKALRRLVAAEWRPGLPRVRGM
ncbi:MAG: deoxyribonuclease IV [Armatimonadia bacterium]